MPTARSEVLRTKTVSRLHHALSSANLPKLDAGFGVSDERASSAYRVVCLLCCGGERHVTRVRDDPRRGGGPPRVATHAVGAATFSVILSLSFCHLLNDMMQSLVPALYPILKSSYGLTFSQVGLITLAFQFTASMLQPVVGMCTDRR